MYPRFLTPQSDLLANDRYAYLGRVSAKQICGVGLCSALRQQADISAHTYLSATALISRDIIGACTERLRRPLDCLWSWHKGLAKQSVNSPDILSWNFGAPKGCSEAYCNLMTSLLTADLPSDDEDDKDFNPDAEQLPTEAVRKRAGDRDLRGVAPVQTAAKRAKVEAVWDLLNKKIPVKSKQQPQHQSQLHPQQKGPVLDRNGPPPQSPLSATREKAAGETAQKPAGQALRALAAARAAAAGVLGQKETLTVTRQFAGKKVEIQVDKAEAAASSAKAAKQKSSLDAVLSSLQGTKKANVLDKSRGDWSAFKKSDSSTNEELTAHANSNNRYLDKVDFLKRAELNEYEQDTATRRKGDIRLRGQL